MSFERHKSASSEEIASETEGTSYIPRFGPREFALSKIYGPIRELRYGLGRCALCIAESNQSARVQISTWENLPCEMPNISSMVGPIIVQRELFIGEKFSFQKGFD